MPAPQISPLSHIEPQLLVDYFERQGISQAVTRWKYLDAAFNQGRERGFGAVVDGRLAGFIGFIPVTLRWGDRVRQDNWLCDWSIEDPVRDKGLGGAIVAQTLQALGRMIAFGGTEMATRRWQKKAVNTDWDSSPWFRKRLRVGSYVDALQSRKLLPKSKIFDLLGGIALHRSRTPGTDVEITPGVHACVPGLMPTGSQTWRPVYDLAELRWQLEDCPTVEALTCTSRDGAAAALFWHAVPGGTTWKVVPIGPPGSAPAIDACIAGALRHIAERDGREVLVMISRLDGYLNPALAANGFRRAKTTHPMFFLDLEPGEAPHAMEGTSFLDTDEGHRF